MLGRATPGLVCKWLRHFIANDSFRVTPLNKVLYGYAKEVSQWPKSHFMTDRPSKRMYFSFLLFNWGFLIVWTAVLVVTVLKFEELPNWQLVTLATFVLLIHPSLNDLVKSYEQYCKEYLENRKK